MVTVMSKDGKPTQVPASVLSTVGPSLAGSWISQKCIPIYKCNIQILQLKELNCHLQDLSSYSIEIFYVGGTVSVRGNDGKEIQVDSAVQQAVAAQIDFGSTI